MNIINLKKSSCDKAPILKLGNISTTQIVTRLKKSNCKKNLLSHFNNNNKKNKL